MFPNAKYRLIALVDAPPYGSTRLYSKVGDTGAAQLPLVAINNGVSEQWAKIIGDPAQFATREVEPVRFSLTLGRTTEALADRSVEVNLPAGHYLISVDVSGAQPQDVGLIAATETRQFTGTASDLPFRFAQAPYFASERRVFFIVNHSGGPLYVSQFDRNPTASFTVAEVRPIISLSPLEEHNPIDVPPVSSWTATPGVQSVSPPEDGGTHVVGSRGAYTYELASPPIKIKPNDQMRIEAQLENIDGVTAIGVVGETGSWLVPPKTSKIRADFSTKENKTIQIIVANDNDRPIDQPNQFVLQSPKLYLLHSYTPDYIYQLASCHRSHVPLPQYCRDAVPPRPIAQGKN
jgi:hypothetical protein